ncbi:MAG TPA: heparan-alpha-glucosaminide N-acetyltransferase domain-containing protein [Chitinophagaceae bacterium]|nr:heparan-alpha-glucosaminide N-acetyltransferase domain-containing protein [Chitinophagaceae bacterium]HNF30693.1 heparan-alpha-glucosaminide N-acetyltransferase domain-containing protein [Chitinophagaceae bacterium]HNL82458.1 heparan-alpha-glucosaminide N-acetyltransferase domain-containing protein [Chitinophagaceae bacterium]HNM33385.1 heparan-alpha-glucosaminide N-acetyltransferase domain-containing protein [Chitinophagaceae bacterium]HNN31198.1 heparan-alpha-glucosaminide N-acetyltransfer
MKLQTSRIESIDVLRGIVMIIMALDHTRDFYSNILFDPLDLTKTNVPLFFTRWVTHFCAPIFVFLAGTSAYLYLSKGKTKKQAATFLFTRGLWLIFVELTIINFAWSFDYTFSFVGVQVIWAIGWSMIFLSLLVYLKPLYIGIIGILIIATHNSLDNIHVESFGNYKYLWAFLHEQYFFPYNNNSRFIGIMYPIIPWIGVIAAGFWFGTLYKLEFAKRKNILLLLGIACLLLFVLIRYSNQYGDLNIWTKQSNWYFTILSFINCTKYPPSLLFLLITLGIAFIVLAFLENVQSKILNVVKVYGKVPFFYYILHILFIHASAKLVAIVMGIQATNVFDNVNNQWGFGLTGVYVAWAVNVALLYIPCLWFMKVKQKRKDWWLSYL